jgi:hypothetical protein
MNARVSRRGLLGGSAAAALVPAVAHASAPADGNSDADLIRACREFDTLERRVLDLYSKGSLPIADDAERDLAIVPLQEQQRALLDRICAIRAKTIDGMTARAKTLTLFAADDVTDPNDPEDYWPQRMGAAVVRDLAGRAGVMAPVSSNPDAELIQLCADHLVNLARYQADESELEPECDPLWQAYVRTYDGIKVARPQTHSGILAKARAAKADAEGPDGTECPPEWAWDIVNDLLRLSGRA